MAAWSWPHESSASQCTCFSAFCRLIGQFSMSMALCSSSLTHASLPDQAAKCRELRPCGSRTRGDAPRLRSSNRMSVLPVKAAKWQAVFPSGSQIAFTLAPRSRQLCATYRLITPYLFCFIFGISRPADWLFPLKFLYLYLFPPGKFGGNVISPTTIFFHISPFRVILSFFFGTNIWTWLTYVTDKWLTILFGVCEVLDSNFVSETGCPIISS